MIERFELSKNGYIDTPYDDDLMLKKSKTGKMILVNISRNSVKVLTPTSSKGSYTYKNDNGLLVHMDVKKDYVLCRSN